MRITPRRTAALLATTCLVSIAGCSSSQSQGTSGTTAAGRLDASPRSIDHPASEGGADGILLDGSPVPMVIAEPHPTTTQHAPPPSTPASTTSVAAHPTTSNSPSATTTTTALSGVFTDSPESTDWMCRFDETLSGEVADRHRLLVTTIASGVLPTPSKESLLGALPGIEALLPLYCHVERVTGVPAVALAAIHYREANNDPSRSMMSGEPLGTVNPDTSVIEGTTLRDNAFRTAEHFRQNAAEIYGIEVRPSMSVTELAYSFAAFNRGGRYCRDSDRHPMTSPYVSNGVTDDYLGMSWPDVGDDDGGGPAAWGEPESVRGRPDTRLGALTIAFGLGSDIAAAGYEWNTSEPQLTCR